MRVDGVVAGGSVTRKTEERCENVRLERYYIMSMASSLWIEGGSGRLAIAPENKLARSRSCESVGLTTAIESRWPFFFERFTYKPINREDDNRETGEVERLRL